MTFILFIRDLNFLAIHSDVEAMHFEAVERLLTAKTEMNTEASWKFCQKVWYLAAGAGNWEVGESFPIAKVAERSVWIALKTANRNRDKRSIKFSESADLNLWLWEVFSRLSLARSQEIAAN